MELWEFQLRLKCDVIFGLYFLFMAQSLNEIVKQEEEVLRFWKEKNIFQKSLELAKDAKRFVFFEGPPSANAKPGIHHVLGRVYKDLFLRFKAMCGYLVERKGGWDTHGLPIEVQLEKQLGLKNKKDIERYGVQKFNSEAKQLVWNYKHDWESLTERIGFWLDQKNAYITYDWKYMESLWWIIKHIYDQGMLYQDYKVVPYCFRCGTALSAHEVALNYKTVTEASAYVKFKILNSSVAEEGMTNYFLAWTTTPWTLPANTALAVGHDIEYVKLKVNGEILILAKERLEAVKGEGEILESFLGKKLEGATYEPLYPFLPVDLEKGKKRFVVESAGFVSTADGSGIVHIAPAFGEEDMELARQKNLAVFLNVDEEGRFTKEVAPWYGVAVKKADEFILEDLKSRNLLFAKEDYTHEYPFCWRCDTHLLYKAGKSWFIGVSKLKKELLKNNEQINWIPSHIKEGRFGQWLKEIKDWSFSRTRYWGTPLPIWKCGECGNHFAAGSLDDLEAMRLKKGNTYILMRHGHATSNEKQLIDSNVDSSAAHLTQEGRVEVEKTLEELRSKKITVDLIVSSDFPRAEETAKIISLGLGASVVFDAHLRELNTGVFNGKSVKEYHSFFQNPIERFSKVPENGETLRDVRGRMIKFIKELEEKHEGKTIMIISHGDALWMLESALLNLSDEDSLAWGNDNYLKTASTHTVQAKNYPYNQHGEVDMHRPYIDHVFLRCPKCSAPSKRVIELIDVWFDSGAMPFAQWHYPFENKEKIEGRKQESFPADFIAEGVDQTRGWFWSLLAVSTLLKKGPPYMNVISLAHALDKDGKKMSKSKGNVVDPWEMINKYGIDSLRWYFYSVNQAGEPKLFDEKELSRALSGFVRLLWNSWIFFATYARAEQGNQISVLPKKSVLDVWLISNFNKVVGEVREALDNYDATLASRTLGAFIDDLSNWYIRRSRERFAHPTDYDDFLSARKTLGEILANVSVLIAPFTPFLAEALYQNLKNVPALNGWDFKESVHLTPYPVFQKKITDETLLQQMKIARDMVTMFHGLRNKASIKVRQPLQQAMVFIQSKEEIPQEILALVAEEINVKEVRQTEVLPFDDPEYVTEQGPIMSVALNIVVTQFLLEEGYARELMRTIQDMRKQLGFMVNEVIDLHVVDLEGMHPWLHRFEKDIQQKTGAHSFEHTEVIKGPVAIEREFDIGGHKIKVGIKKV